MQHQQWGLSFMAEGRGQPPPGPSSAAPSNRPAHPTYLTTSHSTGPGIPSPSAAGTWADSRASLASHDRGTARYFNPEHHPQLGTQRCGPRLPCAIPVLATPLQVCLSDSLTLLLAPTHIHSYQPYQRAPVEDQEAEEAMFSAFPDPLSNYNQFLQVSAERLWEWLLL